VRLTLALAGLAPAGPARVAGASKVSDTGTDVVLDVLPPAGSPVIVEVPVRGTGSGGGASAEVRSSGGHLLTPPASAPGHSHYLPGCGCGSGGAGGLLGLAALALLAGRRGRSRGAERP
jgi:MYXO-CTERM domain-containing protein